MPGFGARGILIARIVERATFKAGWGTIRVSAITRAQMVNVTDLSHLGSNCRYGRFVSNEIQYTARDV